MATNRVVIKVLIFTVNLQLTIIPANQNVTKIYYNRPQLWSQILFRIKHQSNESMELLQNMLFYFSCDAHAYKMVSMTVFFYIEQIYTLKSPKYRKIRQYLFQEFSGEGIETHNVQIYQETVAKPARKFGHAMQILNHYHYSFLQKFIVSSAFEPENISIA